MITPHKTITQHPPAPAGPSATAPAAPSPNPTGKVLCRNRYDRPVDGLPPGHCAEFDPTNSMIRMMIVSGKLEVIQGEEGRSANEVFLDLLASATEDAPDGRTPEQCVRFAKDILAEFGGLVTYDPRGKWSDHHGREGLGFWGVVWTKRFHCSLSRSNRFQDIRCFASVLAAEYENRHGKHTLGNGMFSRPE